MQAVSDIFLGWVRVDPASTGKPRDFYLRQLRDWKGSAEIETMVPEGMRAYGELCGWTLARAHARTGDRVAIAAYLGGGAAFDVAVQEFADGLRGPERARPPVAAGRRSRPAGSPPSPGCSAVVAG